jgi:hypothetical protein
MNLMIEGSDKFEITPAISKQERSNKRFEFTPASCEAPQVLSVAQIETFNREGFIHGLQLFAPEAIAEICNYFDRLLVETLRSGKSSYSISTAHLKHGRVHDILNHTRLGEMMRDLIGPNVIGWDHTFSAKCRKIVKLFHGIRTSVIGRCRTQKQ